MVTSIKQSLAFNTICKKLTNSTVTFHNNTGHTSPIPMHCENYFWQYTCRVKPAHAVTYIKRSPFSCLVIENYI